MHCKALEKQHIRFNIKLKLDYYTYPDITEKIKNMKVPSVRPPSIRPSVSAFYPNPITALRLLSEPRQR